MYRSTLAEGGPVDFRKPEGSTFVGNEKAGGRSLKDMSEVARYVYRYRGCALLTK